MNVPAVQEREDIGVYKRRLTRVQRESLMRVWAARRVKKQAARNGRMPKL